MVYSHTDLTEEQIQEHKDDIAQQRIENEHRT